jgi:hypothetical protein
MSKQTDIDPPLRRWKASIEVSLPIEPGGFTEASKAIFTQRALRAGATMTLQCDPPINSEDM